MTSPADLSVVERELSPEEEQFNDLWLRLSDVFRDDRGFFLETHHQKKYAARRRQHHEQCLEQCPHRSDKPSRPARRPVDFTPVNVCGIETVTRLGLRHELSPKLMELKTFGDALPESMDPSGSVFGVICWIGCRAHENRV